ncbi:MAG TPA: zf-HC2 domain-containing protein [Ktedonobacterales bacterium]
MMAVESLPTCPAGVTAETLSAWRDDALPAAAAGRLTAHLAGCAACQARLVRYANLAAALRAQPPPGPDGRLSAAVRARVRGERRVPRVAWLARGGRLWRGGIGGLGALAAALLLVAGFAQLFRATATRTGQPSGTPAVTAQPSQTSSTPLTVAPQWQAATFPAGFVVPSSASQSLATRSLDVAPSDGDTAYACMAPAQGQRTQPVIWVTHDRAAHWTERTRVPATGEATNCLVTVDLVNPAVTVVDVLEASAADELFITFNGAATWQSLAATGLTAVGRVATFGARTYALARGSGLSGGATETRLIVTTDRFVSVSAIDFTFVGPSGTEAYWINPADGALLAQTSSGLWQSRDGGATWTQTALPPGVSAPPTLPALAVEASVAGAPWHICLDELQLNEGPLYCTTDGGRTWGQPLPSTMPPLNLTNDIVLAADGAVLVVLLTGTTNTGGGGVNLLYTLFRLPAGNTSWQNLGTVPAPSVIYAPTPGRGVLWALTSPDLAFSPYATLLNVSGGSSAAIYTATYQ